MKANQYQFLGARKIETPRAYTAKLQKMSAPGGSPLPSNRTPMEPVSPTILNTAFFRPIAQEQTPTATSLLEPADENTPPRGGSPLPLRVELSPIPIEEED